MYYKLTVNYNYKIVKKLKFTLEQAIKTKRGVEV